MIERRPFNELAGEDRDWLKARHHFRFSGGDNGASMGWGSLRVWNDDEIAPGAGFPPHAHANMEIITYVREGTVTHRDSLGNEGKTKAGNVQVMSAGTGIRHTEYNSEQEPALIFQIWITPDSNGGPPAWGSQPFPKADRSGRFVAFASGFESDIDALPIRARARVLGGQAQGRPVCRICVWRTTARLPGAFVGHRRCQRRTNSRPRWRRDQRRRHCHYHGNRRCSRGHGRCSLEHGRLRHICERRKSCRK
jgi:quercetin 2,3-dioxygenase